MMQPIKNTVNVIDSRDVIARIEELEAELVALEEAVSEFPEDDISEGMVAARDCLNAFINSEEGQELAELKALATEAEDAPDWEHGEQLINEYYFTKYIEEVIVDCYEMPKGFDIGEWPWRWMKMDYAAAADEARQDYMEVDFNGTTFLIRA